MRELFDQLREKIKAGEDTVLVTIVADAGSAPRGSGARMLVGAGGRIAGTIGGGAVEHESIRIAQEAIRGQRNTEQHFMLSRNDVADIGMICGGNVDVFFRYISAGDRAVTELTEALDALYEQRKPCRLIMEMTSSADAAIGIRCDTGETFGSRFPEEMYNIAGNRPVKTEYEGRKYYIENLIRGGRVYIFGGGHVAQQLVPVLTRCDFSCVVVEDREDFADPVLFGSLAETICLPVDKIAELIPRITEDDYVCIMTRGHQNDYRALYEMLRTPACYIGVIGSRSKISATQKRLTEDGYTEKDIARITAPIGLDIRSETPAEIAVSIAAQLILVRAKKEDNR